MKKIIITIIIVLTLSACSNNKPKNELTDILNSNNYIIIDVRTKEEYNKSHIIDSINIPYNKLDNTLDKDKIILVYCQSGNRSQIAYRTLTDLGYIVYDLGAFSEIDMPKE